MDAELKRLRWQCRRGMKELDLVFERYLDTRFVQSSASQRATFVGLLKLEDDQLWRWLMGYQHPENPQQVELVQALRDGFAA